MVFLRRLVRLMILKIMMFVKKNEDFKNNNDPSKTDDFKTKNKGDP